MQQLEEIVQLFEINQVDEAIHAIEAFLPNASDDEKFTLSEIYGNFGFFEEAIVLLEQLLEQYPNEGQILTALAHMYIELEKDDEAIELLNDIDKQDPFYVQSLMLLADLYQAQGLFEVSEQKLLEAKNILPDEFIIDFALGELFFSIGETSRALPLYEKVLKHTEQINEILIEERLAEGYALLGQYEDALAYYSTLQSKEPNVLFKYGMTAYQQKDYQLAIQVWKELLEIDPYYHSVYGELALAYKEEGLIEEAYDTAKKGLLYDSYDKALYVLAGKLAAELRDDEEAIKHLEEAVALDPEYKEAIMALIALYKQNDHYEEIVQFMIANELDASDEPLYQWELARAYNELENYKEAAHYFREAYKFLQHDVELLKEYGYFMMEEGQKDEAIEALEKYMVLEPMDEEVNEFLERMKFSSFE